jgi:hypothetical protein
MTGFDERQQAWEHKLKQDSDFRFKVTMRRNKMLGLWAAGQLGIEGDAADAYIAQVVKSDFEEAGDEDVVRKVLGDFEAGGVAVDADAIRAKIDTLDQAAAEQLMDGE